MITRDPMAKFRVLTSESVSEGHPDKLADQISDSLLDEALRAHREARKDTSVQARSAIETAVTHGMAFVTGELTMEGYVDVPRIVRETISNVGYVDAELGLDGNSCGVLVSIQEQSPDIAQGVNTGGAGDQGMMYGYAVKETPELMPLPISIAHRLMKKATEVRKADGSLGLRPDAKAQVSVQYDESRPVRIDTIVVSQQHSEEVAADVQEIVRKKIIDPVLAEYDQYVDGDPTYHINPTGRFVKGGPAADVGLTGRKIIVDTYGGLCPHGGGAFSGKDPTKVDRSAAYMSRHVAKSIVAAGHADRCQVALAYAIGVAEPVSLNLETFGTENCDLDQLEKKIREVFNLTPKGIIDHMDLFNMTYLPTSRNGHFGHEEFPWEIVSESAKKLAL